MAGAKWPGNEFNYSPPSSAEVKDEYSYTTIPLYAFGVCMETNVLFFFFLFFLCPLCQLVLSFRKHVINGHLLLGYCVA